MGESGAPVLALRYANDELDDVVVENVSMFRAEMMDNKTLWLCCYFGSDKQERITFYVRSQRGSLAFDVTEKPSDYRDWDTQ